MENNTENIIEGPWQGGDAEITDAEFETAMEELLATIDQEQFGRTIAGVLEFLTVRAMLAGPFYLLTDDEQAITIIAANESAKELRDLLPDNVKSWEELLASEEEYITNADPGDEQDEPAPTA